MCRYHRSGKYFITGTINGPCVIWDFPTKTPIRTLFGHIKEITVLDWSKDGKRLLTGSKDGQCIIWKLPECEKEARYEFNSSVIAGQLHPKQT
jgi:COMPASS component SWD1